MALLTSCDNNMPYYPKTQSKWFVARIQSNQSNTSLNLYLAYPINEEDLNQSETWFTDSANKFNIGDTLIFSFK